MSYARRARRWLTIPGLGADSAYLLNDTFTTDRAGGAVNGTEAEPGPGQRFVTDGNGKLSLSGGSVSFATGGVGTGDPGLWYEGVDTTPGRLLVAQMAFVSGTIEVGLDNDQSGTPGLAVRLGATLQVRTPALLTVGAAVSTTVYQIAIALRYEGAFFFIKGGAFTNWTLLWIGGGANNPIRYPATVATATTGVGTTAHMRVPTALWLPSPLVSDGFSAWGTSDGVGHAEGVAGGPGSGGSGQTWTNQIGTFGATGGVANASALSGGIAAATVDTGKTDTIVTVKVTRGGGVAGAIIAYVDADNLIRLVHNGTNAQLIKRVAGVDTNVISAAATYAAEAEVRASRDGTAYRLYYNNAAVGAQQTISDAVFTSVTKQGLYTTDVANTLNDFTVYARGAGGEYVELDSY